MYVASRYLGLSFYQTTEMYGSCGTKIHLEKYIHCKYWSVAVIYD